MPVPEAPTTPMRPRGTRLLNPRPTPSRIAVPQSGPSISSPRRSASSFSRTSSATETWSEKQKTFSPCASASQQAQAACSPGTDTTAMLAPSSSRLAVRTVRGAGTSPAGGVAARSLKTASATRSPDSGSAPRAASTRSPGPARSSAADHSPLSRSRSRLSWVAMAAMAASTPGAALMRAEATIRTIESRYWPGRTSTRRLPAIGGRM